MYIKRKIEREEHLIYLLYLTKPSNYIRGSTGSALILRHYIW